MVIFFRMQYTGLCFVIYFYTIMYVRKVGLEEERGSDTRIGVQALIRPLLIQKVGHKQILVGWVLDLNKLSVGFRFQLAAAHSADSMLSNINDS